MKPLSRDFYAQYTLVVARQLLGARLVRILPDGTRLSGRIVETEAYTGMDDLASHGRAKQTPRNRPMWSDPGFSYVYLCRGVHWMLNVVTEPEGCPAAVLIRAIEPLEGVEAIAGRRAGRKPTEWTSGPGRLAAALAITGAHNVIDVTTRDAGLWIEPDRAVPEQDVCTGPRIGLGKTPEPWFSMPWRYWIADNPYVSR